MNLNPSTGEGAEIGMEWIDRQRVQPIARSGLPVRLSERVPRWEAHLRISGPQTWFRTCRQRKCSHIGTYGPESQTERDFAGPTPDDPLRRSAACCLCRLYQRPLITNVICHWYEERKVRRHRAKHPSSAYGIRNLRRRRVGIWHLYNQNARR